MDDQFDKDLQKRIREVFDNYEDTTADEGWLLLRKKFPAQQRDRRGFVWLWRGAAAALLLICLGIGLWLNKKPNNQGNVLVKQLKPAPVGVRNKPEPGNTGGQLASAKDTLKKSVPLTFPIPEANKKAAGRVLSNSVAQVGPASKSYSSATQAPTLATGNPKGFTLPVSKNIADAAVGNSVIAQTKTDTLKPAFSQSTRDQFAAANKSATIAPVASVVIKPKPTERSVEAIFREDNSKPLPKINADDVKTKRVRFGVYAATYFNYARGSENQLNIGAGFSSDIKINKNLKLVTGVAIAQNSLNYNNAAASVANAAPSSVIPFAATASYKALSTPVVTNHTASLVGLDVPLNLKYEFNPQKSDAYFLAGFSSGTFINQTYSYNYNYPSLLSPSLQKQDETSSKSFGNFYFAKTLNLAFGIGAPLGKNRLVIEPFLKYPLDGLGAQNIRFGAGGVNLKFNLLAPKR